METEEEKTQAEIAEAEEAQKAEEAKEAEEAEAKAKAEAEGEDTRTLEEKRAALLSEEEKPSSEKEEEEEEVEDVDWDALMEAHPEIAKLGIKGVKEMAARYAGGLKQFLADREFVSQLEKKGINTPETRAELLAKMKPGLPAGEKPSPDQPPAPKNFGEFRQLGIASYVAESPLYQQKDEETGEVIPMSKEKKESTVKSLSDLAEVMSPSFVGDMAMMAQATVQTLLEEQEWRDFKYAKVWDGSGGKPLDDSIRQEVIEHSQKYKATYQEITEEARKDRKNSFEACYQHFVRSTKKDEIDAAKAEKTREEKEKEAKKKLDAAGGAGSSKDGKSLKTSKKPVGEMSLAEKQANLKKRIGERVQ